MSDWSQNPLTETRIAVADWLRERIVGSGLPAKRVTDHELLDLGAVDGASPLVAVTSFRPNFTRVVTGQAGTGVWPQLAVHVMVKRRPDDTSEADREAADDDLENLFDATIWAVGDALANTENRPAWIGIEFITNPAPPPTRNIQLNGNIYRYGALYIECKR